MSAEPSTKRVKLAPLGESSPNRYSQKKPNPVFIDTSSSSIAERSVDKLNGSIGFNAATINSTMTTVEDMTEEEKENALEKEILDFLGDCVVFVD